MVKRSLRNVPLEEIPARIARRLAEMPLAELTRLFDRLDDTAPAPMDLATIERRAIDAALEATNGNRVQASKLLGIDRITLYRKLVRAAPAR